mgnify:CR=1 FL=1
MVRRAKRPAANQRDALLQKPRDRMELCGLDRFPEGHVRQDGGQPFREHALARARRPDQQQIMPAGRGDLERALRERLALDLGQVGNGRPRRLAVRVRAGFFKRGFSF